MSALSDYPDTLDDQALVRLNLTDLNVLMNLLETQVDLHFKPLGEVDQLRVSDSSRLNQLLLKVKEASRVTYAYSGMSVDFISLKSEEIALLVEVLNSMMKLREYLGLRNDCLIEFKKRLGVELYE